MDLFRDRAMESLATQMRISLPQDVLSTTVDKGALKELASVARGMIPSAVSSPFSALAAKVSSRAGHKRDKNDALTRAVDNLDKFVKAFEGLGPERIKDRHQWVDFLNNNGVHAADGWEKMQNAKDSFVQRQT